MHPCLRHEEWARHLPKPRLARTGAKHITESRGSYRMLHDEIRGRITSDGQRDVIVVVDGRALTMDDVATILASHEGFEFELRIRNGLE